MSKTTTEFALIENNIKEQSEAILNNRAPMVMGSTSKEDFDAEIAKGLENIRAGRIFTAAEVRAEMERDFGL